MNDQSKYYGAHSRFYIKLFVSRDGDIAYMVHDADWITDHEIFHENRRAPTVGQFDTLEEAQEWCDLVEEGKIRSTPHEANFEGWPALRDRVRYAK